MIPLDLTPQPRYWTDAGSFEINRCNLDGTDVQVIQNKSARSLGCRMQQHRKAKWKPIKKRYFKHLQTCQHMSIHRGVYDKAGCTSLQQECMR